VRILDLDAAQAAPASATFSPLPPTLPAGETQLPPLTPTAGSSDTIQTTLAPPCDNKVDFIKHLTISDNTSIKGGEPFTKMWQVLNSGTCPWTTDYSLRFFSGDSMGGSEKILLTQTVAPGEMLDIRLNLIAPLEISTYTGHWVLSDPNDQVFGIGADGKQPLAVTIQVQPTARPSPG
jgi:hypothetical protein